MRDSQLVDWTVGRPGGQAGREAVREAYSQEGRQTGRRTESCSHMRDRQDCQSSHAARQLAAYKMWTAFRLVFDGEDMSTLRPPKKQSDNSARLLMNRDTGSSIDGRNCWGSLTQALTINHGRAIINTAVAVTLDIIEDCSILENARQRW